MPKLLIVSWTIYPWPSGSAVIVNNIASQFSKNELVLFGEEFPEKVINRWPINYPRIYYTNPNIKTGKGKILSRWINIRNTIKNICKIIKKEKVTRILCVFPDDYYLFAAFQASKKTNVPFYTWFHNTYQDNYSGYRKRFAQWLQPRIFNHSKISYVMSDGMLNFYKEKYPQYNFKTLVHGFPLPRCEFQETSISDDKVRFVFTGSLNESCRDATVRLINTIIKNPAYEVHLYTGNSVEEFHRHGIIGNNVYHHGFISLDKLYSKLKEYDIMLLPHGFEGQRTEVEYKTIFPTRTIPYLCSNKPILAHTPKGVFLTNFLNENNCAEIVDTKSEEAILKAIDELINNKKKRIRITKSALMTAELFDVKNVAYTLRKGLQFND